MTRTLYLHMGHAKTGSSWIQTSLRMSQDALAAHEIRYAEGDRLAVDADRRITSGNGVGLLDSEASMAARLGRSDIAPDASILFSREHWGSDLDPSLASHLSRIAEQHGFGRISVLLFIRDPMGHASSGWQQRVKRAGSCQGIEDFYREYAFPNHVARTLETLAKCNGVEVRVRNYSRCKGRLLEETAAWLDLPEDSLQRPTVTRVNRSMTRAELALQMGLNSQLGASGRLLSDPLCEQLTDIEPDVIRPSLSVQEHCWNALSDVIERVNAYVPQEHRYQYDPVAPDQAGGLMTVSEDQLRVAGESLGAEIARLRANNASLRATIDRSPSTTLARAARFAKRGPTAWVDRIRHEAGVRRRV
ncbi:hypothetical protein K0U73_02250 [bacterium]|nr:hypothetical protein [bacterium]